MRNRPSICFLFAFSRRRSPERIFLLFFFLLFKTFLITKGERLDTDLSCCDCITMKRGELSVDYAYSLTCQSRFHVAVSVYFETLFGLKLKKA